MRTYTGNRERQKEGERAQVERSISDEEPESLEKRGEWTHSSEFANTLPRIPVFPCARCSMSVYAVITMHT